MATPPTFTLYAEVANWFTKGTAARTVAGVSWSASDDIYVIGGTGDGQALFNGVPTATGLTFSQIALVNGGWKFLCLSSKGDRSKMMIHLFDRI